MWAGGNCQGTLTHFWHMWICSANSQRKAMIFTGKMSSACGVRSGGNNTVCTLLQWIIVLVGFTLTNAEEYCLFETFNATCSGGQHIYMHMAEFGRMRRGRCITSDTSPLGCVSDVLAHLDERCSGRKHCEVTVFNLREITRCHPDDGDTFDDLFMYLDAEYSCVGVTSEGGPDVPDVNGTCSYSELMATTGYIASELYFTRSRGTPACPWHVQALPGQQVEFALFDFTLTSAISEIHDFGEPGCPVMFVVDESDRDSDVIGLCYGGIEKRHLYTSHGHDVTFHLFINETMEYSDEGPDAKGPFFYIKYEVLGCPDMDYPEESWSVRQGDSLAVGCNNTGETWYLVCKGTEWLGDPANCTEPDRGNPEQQEDDDEFPFGIVIAVFIGIGVGVAAGLLLLGLVMACRKCHSHRVKSQRRAPTNAHDLSKIEVPYKDPAQAQAGAPPGHPDRRIYTTTAALYNQPGPSGQQIDPRGLQGGTSGPHPSTSGMSTMEHPGYHGLYQQSNTNAPQFATGGATRQGAPVTVHSEDRPPMPLPHTGGQHTFPRSQQEPIYDTAAADYDTLRKQKEEIAMRTMPDTINRI